MKGNRDRESYALRFLGLAGRVRVCCLCEMPRAFSGFEDAHEDGWRWKLGNRRIVWWCADCRPSEHVATPARGSLAMLASAALALGLHRPPTRPDVRELAKVAATLLRPRGAAA
jgi:hypothetical protein